ncbi:hypothetical protein DOY81_015023, partial [Sarcophaga bullata]
MLPTIDELTKSTLQNEEHLKLIEKLNDLNKELEKKEALEQELQALKVTLEERSTISNTQTNTLESNNPTKGAAASQDNENLRKLNETLQCELEELKRKSTSEISTLQQEYEDLQATNKQMEDRIMDLERLRAGLQAQKLFGFNDTSNANNNIKTSSLNADSLSETEMQKEELEAKLKTIMAEVQDVSNRNLFLEQKCENYLILEQSNERLKLQNAKLSRQLDETIGIHASIMKAYTANTHTEFEYLRNIMFQYLTGSANG